MQYTRFVAIGALIDPTAPADVAQRATQLLRKRLGDELTVTPLAADADVADVTRRALEVLHPRALIAIGGAAMIGAVASALVDTPTALGIVPTDTDDRLARQLGVPCDHERACATIAGLCAAGHARRIDVVRVDDRIVLSRVVMGRLAEIDAPARGGAFATLRWGLRSLWGLFGPTARFDLEVDGETLRVRASSIVIANTASVGLAGLRWASDVAFDDGIVDVMVIRSSTLIDYVALLSSWLTGKERRRQMLHLRARARVAVRCSRTVSVTYDGMRERAAQLGGHVVREGLHLLVHGPHPTVLPNANADVPLTGAPIPIVEMRAS